MFARNRLVVLAGLALSPATAAAQGFEYAPGTAQYRVTQMTKASQELMGQKQEFESSSRQLFTLAVSRPHKDTLALAVVLDSLTQVGPMGPAPGSEKLVGAKVDARISPTGTLYSTSARDSSIAGVTGLAEGLGRFLPRVRGRLAKGSSWADTSAGKTKQGGLDIDRRTISRFTVVGDTTIGGQKSWKVVREDSTTMSGSGVSQGQALTMEGTSTGKGALFLSEKGTFLGAEGDEQANIKLVLSANGMEVTVVQSANTKVEKVK